MKEAGMVKKRWADLSAGQKVTVVLLGAAQVALLAAALWDLAHRSADEVRGEKRMWAALVFINWVGPIAYFTIGRKGLCESQSTEIIAGDADGEGI
jgi:hypothetical protein